MRDYLKDACEDIDAVMFSGDAFDDAEHRKELREYMGRWERQMKVNEDQVLKELVETVDKLGLKYTGSYNNNVLNALEKAKKLWFN